MAAERIGQALASWACRCRAASPASSCCSCDIGAVFLIGGGIAVTTLLVCLARGLSYLMKVSVVAMALPLHAQLRRFAGRWRPLAAELATALLAMMRSM